MTKIEETAREYKEVRDDYAFDPSIFNGDDERIRKVKYIINNRLTVADKTIIILYAECGAYRKLGAKLGLSHTTIRKEVLRTRKQIFTELEKL